MDRASQDRFIEAWGQMGSLWGINPSTARVHALLMASGGALGLDDISRRLKISRGNASMSLKELRNWGVVRKVKMPGDRRDYYETEPDVWKMFFAILRERKRREFDPLLEAVRAILSSARGDAGPPEKRFRQMAELLGALDMISARLLSDEAEARSILGFLSGKGNAV